MNISSRITQILEEKAITKTEFASLLGVERKTVYNILAKKDMGIQVLEKISKALDIPLGKLIGIDMDDPKCEFVEVPILETGAKASFLESYSDLSKSMGIYPVHKEVVAGRYNKLIIMVVEGNSMEPTLMNRAKILITPIDSGNWVYINSGVYVVSFRDHIVVKRVQSNDIMEKGLLKLYSDNPTGGEMNVRVDDIGSIWKVLKIVDSDVN